MIKKLIYRCVLFVSLSLGLLYLADIIFTNTLSNDPLNKVAFARHFKNETFDFAFLGNSRVLVMSRTEELQKLTGKRGINLALDGSNIMHQYLILSNFLDKNQVKDVYMNIDPWGLQFGLDNPSRIWCFMPFINDPIVSSELANIFGKYEVTLWRLFPFQRYSYFNSRLGPFSLINSKISFIPTPFNSCGDYSHIAEEIIPKKPVLDDVKLNILVKKANVRFLIKILKLCHLKGVQLHLYTAPVIISYYRNHTNIDSVLNSVILPTANMFNVNYTNFCLETLCSDSTNFYDHHHLNKRGVEKFTPLLKELMEKP